MHENFGCPSKSQDQSREKGREMAKIYIVVVAFVFLVVLATGRDVPGGSNKDEDQTLELASTPAADPPSSGRVLDQKNIFGGMGGFAGMGGYIGGLFPHLGGIGVIGKYGGIGGGIGFGHGGFGGGVGGIGGVGGGVGGLPFP